LYILVRQNILFAINITHIVQDNKETDGTINNFELLFEDIYKRYYVELCMFAQRFIPLAEEAEEIVQDVIYKLWENKESIDSIQSVRSYLYTSVRNKSLNLLKHKKIEEKYRDEAWIELKSIENAVYEEASANELQEKISHSIDELPDRCREVFLLSRTEGLKNKDISERLGITVKAVEANISRALSSLRLSLKEYLGAELIVIFLICSIWENLF